MKLSLWFVLKENTFLYNFNKKKLFLFQKLNHEQMNDEDEIKGNKFTKFQFNFEYESQHTGSTFRHFDVRINPTSANK